MRYLKDDLAELLPHYLNQFVAENKLIKNAKKSINDHENWARYEPGNLLEETLGAFVHLQDKPMSSKTPSGAATYDLYLRVWRRFLRLAPEYLETQEPEHDLTWLE
jgi:hypothetical protein